ncbi:MAG: DegV family protein [Lachnospiraceae bacterium]|nr:DegV family protein [Lachnospiraceae bacterium]
MEYQIISDGSCDLPPRLVKEKNILVVPFYVSFDDRTYKKENVEIGIRDFYEEMVRNPKVYPKSSMPSTQDYVDVFTPLAKQGTPIICICITTKFSGSMQSALTAKDMVLETCPDARITVIDSTVDTVLQGQYVLEAARMQAAGWEYDAVIDRLEAIKSTGRIFFTVGDIEYLKHGGRIGKLSGLAGSILGIKPLITLKEGEIFPSGITRSRKKSLDKVLELLIAYLKETGKDIHSYSFSIGFGYDTQEAEDFKLTALSYINENYKGTSPLTAEELPIFQIGATISVHTGPYPLGFGIIERAF